MTAPTLPDLTPDALLIAAIEEAFTEDILVKVVFPKSSATFTYLAPPTAKVGSRVLVPPNRLRSQPSVATVVELNPPPPSGVQLRRVLEVLS